MSKTNEAREALDNPHGEEALQMRNSQHEPTLTIETYEAPRQLMTIDFDGHTYDAESMGVALERAARRGGATSSAHFADDEGGWADALIRNAEADPAVRAGAAAAIGRMLSSDDPEVRAFAVERQCNTNVAEGPALLAAIARMRPAGDPAAARLAGSLAARVVAGREPYAPSLRALVSDPTIRAAVIHLYPIHDRAWFLAELGHLLPGGATAAADLFSTAISALDLAGLRELEAELSAHTGALSQDERNAIATALRDAMAWASQPR